MADIRNILIAVDFGDADKNLLAMGGQMALKFGAAVWVVHIAMPDPDFVGYEPGPQYIRDLRAKDLRKEHHTLKEYADTFKKANITAEALLVQGMQGEAVLDEIKKLNIDLFIMGAHKHGFFHRLLSDNDPSLLAVKSKVPVLLIP